MTRALIAGAVLTVVGMWADYAGARPADVADVPADLEAAETCEARAEQAYEQAESAESGSGDAAYENAILACADAVADVDAYNLAVRALVVAPAFCQVTYIERDATHGYRAVCVLVSEGGAL